MGAIGNAPTGLKQTQLKTLFLRAPYTDFPAISQGYKTEFRTAKHGAVARAVFAPSPVVLYAVSTSGRSVHKLMVLSEYRTERLFDIAEQPQALAREGMESYDHFRRYWRARTKRPFRAMQQVDVFTVGPFIAAAADVLGMSLLQRLYGDYVPA